MVVTTHPVPSWLPWILFGIAGALLAGVGLLAARTRAFLSRATEAHGEVVALEERRRIRSPRPLYFPVVVFTTPSGQRNRFTSPSGSADPDHAVGDAVTVLFDAERPDAACIRSFASLWLVPIVLGGFGLVFALLGILLRVMAR